MKAIILSDLCNEWYCIASLVSFLYMHMYDQEGMMIIIMITIMMIVVMMMVLREIMNAHTTVIVIS